MFDMKQVRTYACEQAEIIIDSLQGDLCIISRTLLENRLANAYIDGAIAAKTSDINPPGEAKQ